MDVIDGDLVEVPQACDVGANTAQVAARMLFEMPSMMQYAPSLRDE